MSQKLVERIKTMDDFRVVRFFVHFSQKLFDEVDISQEQLLSQVPEEIRNTKELLPAFDLSPDAKKTMFKSEDAVICSRSILEALAQHPGFEETLEKALDEYRDDDMFAGVILALGLAASMIIMAATTKLKFKKSEEGKVSLEIIKDDAPTDMVKNILSPLSNATGKIASYLGGMS